MPDRNAQSLSDPEINIGDLPEPPLQATLKMVTETKPAIPSITSTSNKGTAVYSNVNDDEAREAALRYELMGIRGINQAIEGVVDSLERAKGNMETVSRTVNNASTLLNTWTRILSQTEHNQRLILNCNWHGTSQDISNIENENMLKRQEKERREMEEAQRREASLRKAEDEGCSRKDTSYGRGNRGVRGRASGAVKGASNGHAGIGGQGTGRGMARGAARGVGITTGRVSSGIVRGLGGRGRGRGLS